MSDRKAVIKNADMSEEMQQDAVDCATQVWTLLTQKLKYSWILVTICKGALLGIKEFKLDSNYIKYHISGTRKI